MWIRIILLILISPYIFVYGKEGENQSRLLPNGSSKSRLKKLQSPVHLYSIDSKYRYVQVLVWHTPLTPKQLKIYFANFELLELKEKWLDDHKVDTVKQTETTYERFILVYYSEKQSIITVFLKLNLQNNQKNVLIKSTMEEVQQILKNYSFIYFNEDQTIFAQLGWFNGLVLFWCIILPAFICIVYALSKLCQLYEGDSRYIQNSRYIQIENLLRQNAENKPSSQNDQNPVTIRILTLPTQNIDSKSHLQDVQNWVDHINEYKDSPESEKKSFIDSSSDFSSFSNNS